MTGWTCVCHGNLFCSSSPRGSNCCWFLGHSYVSLTACKEHNRGSAQAREQLGYWNRHISTKKFSNPKLWRTCLQAGKISSFFFFPDFYAGVDSFVLVSTSPCEGLSGWAAVQGEFWVIFLCDFSCLTVWSTEPDQDVNTLQFRRPLSRDELEAFGHRSQTNRGNIGKKHRQTANTEYPETSNCCTSVELCQCWDSKKREDNFSLKKTSPFFFPGSLKFFWGWTVLASAESFYSLPLSTNTSLLSSFTALWI